MNKNSEILDQIVWDAHFQVPLPEQKAALQIIVPVSFKIWQDYWRVARQECRGWWHGATGLIAERLHVTQSEWNRVVRFHNPKPATKIGDASHDYSYLIEAACITSRCSGAKKPAR